MPRLKCEIHGEATREYLACIHVMIGGPISLFQEATEHTPSSDGEAGFMVCSECAELDEGGTTSQHHVDLRQLCGSAYGRSGFCQVTRRQIGSATFPHRFVHTLVQVFPVLCRQSPSPKINCAPREASPFPRGLGSNFVGVTLPAKILIVDDHLAARTTIRSLLDWHGFQVIGEAKDGKEAIEQVIELKPDIVLLDINMPVMNGISAALEIRQIAPQVKILFFTIHEAPALIASLRPFAHGFVSKSAAGTELIPMVTRLAGVTPARPKKGQQQAQ